MKKSLVITVVAGVMLVATGFAANAPTPDQSQYAGSQMQDLHFQYYLEIRPLLISDQSTLTVRCDDGKAGPAPRLQGGTADSRELAGYAY